MNQDEWDEHWHNNWQQYQKNKELRRRLPLIREVIRGKTIDIGVGVVNIYKKGDDITGVDISAECIRLMQERQPWGKWIVGDMRNTGLPESSFDTVICSHVFEHYYDHRPIIDELKRLAKPDGNIVIIVPRKSIGHDHVHPKWWPGKIEELITCYLGEPKYELRSRTQWVIQGKKTATATVVMIAWSPNNKRLKIMKGCVNSLKQYTKHSYKWVVVDNGPAEQTEYIRSMLPDIHIQNKANQGPPMSRNAGAFVTESDYIAFVDNDVEFYENWLTDSIALLEKYPVRKLIAVPTNCPIMRRPTNLLGKLDDCNLARFAGSACWIMKRRSFREIGPWSNSTPNDVDYSIRAVALGYEFICPEKGPFVRHLAWHNRTFKGGFHFVDGEWKYGEKDYKVSVERRKRILLAQYALNFRLKVFVETGTYKGDTVKEMLLTELFTQIWSVDIDAGRVNRAKRRFRSFDYIHCDQENSATWLPRILKEICEPALFWLDAHASCKQIARDKIESPIFGELKAILSHNWAQSHVILIDDARYYNGDIPNYPTLKELKSLFPNDWVFEVKDDIIRAYQKKQKKGIATDANDEKIR